VLSVLINISRRGDRQSAGQTRQQVVPVPTYEATPAEIRARTIVYADGWGIGIDAPSLLGGDDFAEPFDLCDPTWISDGTLLGMLREAVQHHDTWLLLQLSHNRQQFRLTTQ
jgi:hypothetical protein